MRGLVVPMDLGRREHPPLKPLLNTIVRPRVVLLQCVASR